MRLNKRDLVTRIAQKAEKHNEEHEKVRTTLTEFCKYLKSLDDHGTENYAEFGHEIYELTKKFTENE